MSVTWQTRQRLFLLLALLVLPAVAQAQAETGEFFNPYLAEKNLEVGQFYLKKKNYDAAIARFLEAIRHKPNFAKPHRLLGEAYEKKGEPAEAIKYYSRYLEILPAADDAAKVRKRIAKLQRKLLSRRPRPSG